MRLIPNLMFDRTCFCLTNVERATILVFFSVLIYKTLTLVISKDTSLAKRCTGIGSVCATFNVRMKAMPIEEIIVCNMNGESPELFGKRNVTPCISECKKYLKESEKCPLRNWL